MTQKGDDEKNSNIPSVVWRAAEFERRERTLIWYVSIVTVAALLIIFALFQNNFFFAFFIFLATGVLVFFSSRKPRTIEFRIDDTGITAGLVHYAFDALEHFQVRERPGQLHEIIIKRKTTLNPLLKIAVDEKTAEAAKRKLLEKLPEMSEDQESLLDIFTDWLGF